MSTLSYAFEQMTKARHVPSRQAIRRAALAFAAALAVAGATTYGHYYVTAGRYLETTDDAYVKADSTIVAPKVSGYIAEVLVADSEPVQSGQVLARIDDRDFKTALMQAQADVAASEAAVKNLNAQIELAGAADSTQAAEVDATEANLKFAQQERARYDDLMKSGAGTIQRAQQTDAAFAFADRTIAARQGGIDRRQQADRGALDPARTGSRAARSRSRAGAAGGAERLLYAVITAPVDGTVGARTLRVGQYVQAGTQLMAVVPLNAVYVVANFKETQLTHLRNGQPVELRVDSFHSTKLKGHVDSLSPASGLEFALLPPDNATGNFTKIVQRVPVKIVLDDPSLNGLLRPGMSAEPTVNTKSAVVAERDAERQLASRGGKPRG